MSKRVYIKKNLHKIKQKKTVYLGLTVLQCIKKGVPEIIFSNSFSHYQAEQITHFYQANTEGSIFSRRNNFTHTSVLITWSNVVLELYVEYSR